MRSVVLGLLVSVSTVGSAAADPDSTPPPHPPTTDLPSGAGEDAQPQPQSPIQVAPSAPVLQAPAVTTPPVVTISTMPVTRTVDGYWDDRPRTDAWIATGITAGFVAATITWWLEESRFTNQNKGNNPNCVPDLGAMGHDANNCNAAIAGEDDPSLHRQHVWTYVEFGLGAATAASAFITATLWSHHHHGSHQVVVAPSASGGSVSVTGSF